jgi:hypothetical protein
MTYDSFHKNADRMYCVYMPSIYSPTGIGKGGALNSFAGYFKSIFPEIASSVWY